MFMLNWLKLSQHVHSGRLRPHEHTSYISLIFMLIVVGVALTAYTVYAATPYDGPEAGSIGITGTMPGKAPVVAATIDSPVDQNHTTTTPVSVGGTCPADTLVEIYKNSIFAGSTPCTGAGSYLLDIDLLVGKNELIARDYNALNQVGPDSNKVTVFYDALPIQTGPITSLNFGGSQLLLNTDAVFRGVFPDQDMSMPIDILGGNPPYALNIQWGDASNKVVPRNDNSSFTTSHKYTKAGNYQISLQATDAAGRVAFLTVAAIVNGQPNVTSITTASSDKLQVLWPLYVGAIGVVISFWLGEKREKRILRTRGLLSTS